MRKRLLPHLALSMLWLAPASSPAEPTAVPITMVIHGGAGTLLRANFTAEQEAQYRAKLEESLTAGYRILEQGGSSLDAVETAIRILEDSELFNAGKGAVFTADGRNELDASIMDGSTSEAGAVAAVTTIKHPVSAARAVMEKSDHVLLVGPGAEAFAAEVGLEIVEPDYFFTQRRWDALQRQKQKESAGSAGSSPPSPDPNAGGMGTVGALALDRQGRLAAATSTGGTTNKRYGRVGDSPIIGAGTWADADCAVSGTGTGEYFIRHAVAHDICARAHYLEESVAEAADYVVFEVLDAGIGGVITLDGDGNVAMPFNTEGMYRGFIKDGGAAVVEIYKD